MRAKQFTMFLILAALVSAVGLTMALAAGATAKAWLAQAQQAANKWKSDAVLVHISTLAANMDGTAKKWGYIFYSAKAKQGYTVDVQDGKIIETLEVNPWITDPVGKNFVDSSQAVKEAMKNGLNVKGKLEMALGVMGQATKQPWLGWVVNSGFKGAMIDAKTGKFLTLQELKLE